MTLGLSQTRKGQAHPERAQEPGFLYLIEICIILSHNVLLTISALNDFQEYLLTADEKSVLNEFLEFTKPYIEDIHMSEKDHTFFSEILVIYAGLLDFISGATHQKEIVRVLKSETASRFDALLGNELATFALYCDPRFSYLPGILKNITWSNIENEVETYCGSIRVVTTDANGASHVAPPAPKKVKDDG
ncbi:hypothetical protein L5515_010346 [Caenorhabditis briggsae]|uniref:Uncharacterized protein n=1 Tax=Caenorhabditis briggsae TaxID=6238 RepID=A0AAE9JEY4_CAEBR|nr:hypothetical protein L5515_010346 [Caenorhabditis briggsae]